MRKSQEELSLNNSNGEINQCNKKLEEIDKRQCPFNLDEYKEKVKSLNEQMKELKKVITGLTHQIEIDKELIDILGDDGIKVYFFRKLIPILNQNINSYLKKFELPICLEFDEQMQETIINGRSDMEYDQFSGGEKTRIDMSVLLSFFNISRIISNWSCNLLFIDEILDGGIDKNGIEQFLATLYNIVSDNEKKLGIYLVSHKIDDVKIEINKTIEIKKKGLFSELEVK
jgi:DNA repair exonuclease SbcCD ATPase subunit